jgi:hypothetical protein
MALTRLDLIALIDGQRRLLDEGRLTLDVGVISGVVKAVRVSLASTS